MVYLIEAKSHKPAIGSSSFNVQDALFHISFRAEGLSLNPNSMHNVLNVAFSLGSGKLKKKINDYFLWLDILNDTLTTHNFKGNKAVSVKNLVPTLGKHTCRNKAILHCQREGRRNMFEDLSVRIKLMSSRKYDEWWS